MTNYQSGWRSTLLLALVSLLTLTMSCSKNDNPTDEPVLTGIISSYNEFDAAMLDFTETDMVAAGFILGDLISITIDDREIVMQAAYCTAPHHRSATTLVAPTTYRNI